MILYRNLWPFPGLQNPCDNHLLDDRQGDIKHVRPVSGRLVNRELEVQYVLSWPDPFDYQKVRHLAT